MALKIPKTVPQLPPSKLTVNATADHLYAAMASGFTTTTHQHANPQTPIQPASNGHGFFWEDESQSEMTPATDSSSKRKRGGQELYDWPSILNQLSGFIAQGGSIIGFSSQFQIPRRTLYCAMNRHKKK